MAKVLSIDISAEKVRIVEMDYIRATGKKAAKSTKKPKVYRCLEMNTPEKTITDGYLDRGKIDVLAGAISNLLKENKVRTKKVLFTVFSSKVISREIVLPPVKIHQINAIIQANLSEYLPIELDEYKISHMYIETLKGGEGAGRHRVQVIAMENKLIDGYDALATALGLRIVDVDYVGNSIVEATKHSAGAAPIMVVKIERRNALITVLQNNTNMLQRVASYAVDPRTDEELSRDEALASLFGTISRIIDFFESRDDDTHIERVYLTGGYTTNEKLADMMGEQIGLPVELLNRIKGVVLGRDAEDAKPNLYAAAIGAGINSVGFADQKEKERHETNYASATLLILILFVVLIAAIMSLALFPYNTAKMEEASLNRQISALSEAKAVYDEHENLAALYEHIEYGHLLTMHSNDTILDFLTELEEMLPSDVEVTEFTSDDEYCIMTMRVSDKETAAAVINNLRGFNSLATVTVDSIAEEEPEEGEAVSDTATVTNEDADTQDSDEGREASRDVNTTIYFTVTCNYNVTTPVSPEVAASEDTATE